MRGNQNSTKVLKFIVEGDLMMSEKTNIHTLVSPSKPIGKSYKSCVCMSVLSVLKLEKWRLKHIYFTTRRIFKHQSVIN